MPNEALFDCPPPRFPEPWHEHRSTRCRKQRSCCRKRGPERSQKSDGNISPALSFSRIHYPLLPPLWLSPLATLLSSSSTPLSPSSSLFHCSLYYETSLLNVFVLLFLSASCWFSKWYGEPWNITRSILVRNIHDRGYHSNKFPWHLDTDKYGIKEWLPDRESEDLSHIPALPYQHCILKQVV